MRTLRIASGLFAVVLLGALAGAERADARVDVHVGVAVPPPPTVVFEHEPEVTVVPSTDVYYVPNQDYDLFRYHGVWYLNRGGYWYTARTYRGSEIGRAHV